MSADARDVSPLTIFYEVNKAQHFEFPHSNCDTYTNDQLTDLYFKQSGFGEFCAGVIGRSVDLKLLRHNSQFVNYITSWMRLKFTAEQVDPVRYQRYFERLPIPAHKTPKLPTELLEIYKADSTEFYSFVDSLANKIQIQWIEMMMGYEGRRKCLELDIVCTQINTEFQTIRSCTQCDPYEYPIRPFLEFQHTLRRILAPCFGALGAS
jgi:hypothetical protein